MAGLIVEGIGGEVMGACLEQGVELAAGKGTIRMKGTRDKVAALEPFVKKHTDFIHRALTLFASAERPVRFGGFH